MSMTCMEVHDRVSEYLTGELSGGDAAEFEQHTQACGECGAFVSASRVTLQLSRSAVARLDDPRPEDVPESLVRAILAAGSHCQT